MPVAPPVETAGAERGSITTSLTKTSLAPELSVIVSLGKKRPACVYVWLTTDPEPVLPSPKLHDQPVTEPSGSLEPLPSNDTACGAGPPCGAHSASATGAFEPPFADTAARDVL